MKTWLIYAAAMLWAATAASTARAQATVSVPVSVAPVIGDVIRGSVDSVFSVSTSGVVTRISGNAIRIDNGSVTAPIITVRCGNSGKCNNQKIRVRIWATGSSGDAVIVTFRTGLLSGGTYSSGSPPTEASALDFNLNAIGKNRIATFRLGIDVLLPNDAQVGTQTLTYSVIVDLLDQGGGDDDDDDDDDYDDDDDDDDDD